MQTYTFVASSVIGSRTLHVGQLQRELEASALHAAHTLYSAHFDPENDELNISFQTALDSNEQNTLAALLAAHDYVDEESEQSSTLATTNGWVLREEQETGTNGGTMSRETWQVRKLNVIDGETESGTCALNNDNTFSLGAGKFKICLTAPAFGVQSHRARLVNVTTDETVAYGRPTQTYSRWNGMTTATTVSEVKCIVTVDSQSAPTTFCVEHRGSDQRPHSGLGLADGLAGAPEVYTIVNIEQLS